MKRTIKKTYPIGSEISIDYEKIDFARIDKEMKLVQARMKAINQAAYKMTMVFEDFQTKVIPPAIIEEDPFP